MKGGFRKVRSKEPKVLAKGHVRPKSFNPRAYRSMLGSEDMAYIWVLYGVPEEFDLELPSSDTRVDNTLPGQL